MNPEKSWKNFGLGLFYFINSLYYVPANVDGIVIIEVEIYISGSEIGKVNDIIDEFQQQVWVSLNYLTALAAGFFIQFLLGQEAGETGYGTEWRPDFMTHVR